MLKFLDKHGDRMRYFDKNNQNYQQSSKTIYGFRCFHKALRYFVKEE